MVQFDKDNNKLGMEADEIKVEFLLGAELIDKNQLADLIKQMTQLR